VLIDPNVSRRHCTIAVTPVGLVVTDLRSRHGTLLNGLPVTQSALREGDWLQVGSVGLCLMKS
jgi:pSer/pThr/pTyr-binding forkhead associated (FHA) protein